MLDEKTLQRIKLPLEMLKLLVSSELTVRYVELVGKALAQKDMRKAREMLEGLIVQLEGMLEIAKEMKKEIERKVR